MTFGVQPSEEGTAVGGEGNVSVIQLLWKIDLREGKFYTLSKFVLYIALIMKIEIERDL